MSVNDLRLAVATQQIYETLARGGSRYLSTLRSFFGIEAENPFSDIPLELGHLRLDLDMYQVAQTSASQDGSTAQGSLAGFGYTDKGGFLFNNTFVEHGYLHILMTVRHKNVYSTYFAPDNFRRTMLDFYMPQLANIGEQPIRLATLNPFNTAINEDERVIAYQEAWWEYRYDVDECVGEFRTGLENGQTITGWTYADGFDPGFTHVNGDWLYSNSQEVLDRTLSVTSEAAPQFGAVFQFNITKRLPMPTYSVPGLDII